MRASASTARWWSRSGIRIRTTVVAVAASAVAILLGAIALLLILDLRLTASTEQAVTVRLQDLSAQVANKDPAGIQAFAGSTPGDTTVVQVIDESGRVLVASLSIEGEPAIVAAYQEPTDVQLSSQSLPFVDGIEYAVASQGLSSGGTTITVVAAQSLEPVTSSTSTIALALAFGGPLLLLGVGLVTWLAVGRSLESVRRIRARVEEIDGYGLSERVPVPNPDDEVANLARTMNHMLDRAQSAMVQQQQFVADASHELKTPLATMRTALDVASRTDGDFRAIEPTLDGSIQRMTDLVEDLLTLARAEDCRSSDRLADVDLDAALSGAIAGVDPASTDTRITVYAEPVRIAGNATLVQRALRNVIENAVTFARSRVSISLNAAGDLAVVEVADDGPGIPNKDRERVLERFVRLDAHRSRDSGGTGLGLAIAKEVVAVHRGRISIEDSELGGALVRIEFPTSQSATTDSSSR